MMLKAIYVECQARVFVDIYVIQRFGEKKFFKILLTYDKNGGNI